MTTTKISTRRGTKADASDVRTAGAERARARDVQKTPQQIAATARFARYRATHRAELSARNRQRQAALRARWKAHGCCPTCGLPTTRYVSCTTCRAKQAAIALAWWRKQQAAA